MSGGVYFYLVGNVYCYIFEILQLFCMVGVEKLYLSVSVVLVLMIWGIFVVCIVLLQVFFDDLFVWLCEVYGDELFIYVINVYFDIYDVVGFVMMYINVVGDFDNGFVIIVVVLDNFVKGMVGVVI